MAVVYDLETNYQAKIHEAERLMEKGYIDQALCLLEDFLVNVRDNKILGEVKKQMLTGYILKREFETCEQLINEIKDKNCLDLSLIAHDIVISLLQGLEDVAQVKQDAYFLEMSNPLMKKNVMELVYHLKMSYETYWYEKIKIKVEALSNEAHLSEQLLILSDLEALDSQVLGLFNQELQEIANSCPASILQVLIFDLLDRKGIEASVTFKDETSEVTLQTNNGAMAPLYHQIDQALDYLECCSWCEDEKEFMKQQIILFYQSVFPFFKNWESRVVVERLKQVVLGHEFSKSGFFSDEEQDFELLLKMNSYIRSLSSLM